MFLLQLIAIVSAMVVFVLLLTQIVLPFIFTTPFFPLFRKETPMAAKVEEAERDLEEKTELFRLEKRLLDLDKDRAILEKQIAEQASKPQAWTE